jgi:hypothetical protein
VLSKQWGPDPERESLIRKMVEKSWENVKAEDEVYKKAKGEGLLNFMKADMLE